MCFIGVGGRLSQTCDGNPAAVIHSNKSTRRAFAPRRLLRRRNYAATRKSERSAGDAVSGHVLLIGLECR